MYFRNLGTFVSPQVRGELFKKKYEFVANKIEQRKINKPLDEDEDPLEF